MTTAVTNPNLPIPPFGNGDKKDEPKLQICEVGPFRLKGVKVDLNQFTEDQIREMMVWARENDAYVAEDTGLFSWKSEAKRDWFILRWS
jgi:hypothetical protein